MGDEPFMLQLKLKDVPVIVDADRLRAARYALSKYGAQCVILDDGFQQWKTSKDLEIVAVDAARAFGNRHLLPRGILREPLSSLRRADIFVLTKTNLLRGKSHVREELKAVNPDSPIVEAIHSPVSFSVLGCDNISITAEELKGKTAALICGIADPDSFEGLISSLGIKIAMSFKFPDHHDYTKEELETIFAKARDAKVDAIITTEKDAVRFRRVQSTEYRVQILILHIE